jgi:hypothetical protein
MSMTVKPEPPPAPAGAGDGPDARDGRERIEYEPPVILWQESYAPMAFGASCAKQPGNCGANPPKK